MVSRNRAYISRLSFIGVAGVLCVALSCSKDSVSGTSNAAAGIDIVNGSGVELESEQSNKRISWSMQPKRLRVRGHIKTIRFVNNSVGWASSTDGLYKTVDAGDTWSRAQPELDSSETVLGIYFVSESSGALVAQREPDFLSSRFRIFSTADGGTIWTQAHVEEGGVATSITGSGSKLVVSGFKYLAMSPVCFNPILLTSDANAPEWTPALFYAAELRVPGGCLNKAAMGATISANGTERVITNTGAIYERNLGLGDWKSIATDSENDHAVNVRSAGLTSSSRLWYLTGSAGMEGIRSSLVVEGNDSRWHEFAKAGYYFSDVFSIGNNYFLICGYKINSDRKSEKATPTVAVILVSDDGGRTFEEIFTDRAESEFVSIVDIGGAGLRLWILGESGKVIELKGSR